MLVIVIEVIEVSLKLESYWFELTSYLGPLCILQYAFSYI